MPDEFSSLFDQQSITVVPPRAGGVSNTAIRIPVGNYDDLDIVEIGTSLVILLAFVIVLQSSLRVVSRLSSIGHVKAE
jgi:hypothetical protein